MPGLLNNLAYNPLLNMGMGLLAGGGPRNPNQWGAGLQGGLLNMQNAQQIQAQQEQLAQLAAYRQQQAEQQKAEHELRVREQQQAEVQRLQQQQQLEAAIAGLPEDQKALIRANPDALTHLAKQQFATPDAPGGQVGKINAGNYTPESVQAFQESAATGAPNYALLKRYTPPQSPYFTVVPTAGGMIAVDTRNPDNVKSINAVRSADDVDLQGNLARVKAKEGAVGKATGDAQAQLPVAEVTVNRLRDQVISLKKHPGKKDAVGGILDSKLPAIPGTPKADFLSQLDQIKGGAFLQARVALKGGGSISDAESVKAEAAFGRMSRALNESDFDKALDEFLEAVEDGYKALEKTAGVDVGAEMTDPTSGITIRRKK